VNSQPYFSDPEAWKPAQISADVMRGLRQQFRKKFQTVTNCTKEDVENPKLWNYQDSDIKLINAYSSKNRWSVARIRLEENLCDGIPGDDFVDHWFVIDPAGEIEALGQEMWLVDAGDYDNDGKSEILFSINAYDRGGYILFYDDFAKHATFEFIYH